MTFELPDVKTNEEALSEVLIFSKNNNYTIETNENDVVLYNPTNNLKLLLRKNTSDFHVFTEIFIKKDYQSLIENYQKYSNNINPKVIIDIGANIGCASLYFKQNYPEATMVCIEAEKNNFLSLKHNIELNNSVDSYKNIYLQHNAFWITEEDLMIEENFRDGRDWAFAARPNAQKSTQTIKGLTIQNILEKYNFSKIDILKIDIEGGEKWILEDELTMNIIQKNVNTLFIEVHEEVITMKKTAEILANFGFKTLTNDALIFGYK
ncbi:MAG: FkbM family methyltransferase [Bacteroidetes bacterium]|nr:MAG: FkbM family methyltransferase [Bacteroidota bacterium]TAG86951.1 MAG: FkbM family methyltransferase [Bacteroidota bacterium]